MKIDKDSVEVVILTATMKIVGTVHTLPQERMSDFMADSSASTLPVTSASIFTLQDGKLLARTKFLSLHKKDVTVIFPASDIMK